MITAIISLVQTNDSLFDNEINIFLFILLKMPKITKQAASDSNSNLNSNQTEQQNIMEGELNWRKFACSNVGILFGFVVMFLLAFFEDQIRIG